MNVFESFRALQRWVQSFRESINHLVSFTESERVEQILSVKQAFRDLGRSIKTEFLSTTWDGLINDAKTLSITGITMKTANFDFIDNKWDGFFSTKQSELSPDFGATVEELLWEAVLHVFGHMNKALFPGLGASNIMFGPTLSALNKFKYLPWNESMLRADEILQPLLAQRLQNGA